MTEIKHESKISKKAEKQVSDLYRCDLCMSWSENDRLCRRLDKKTNADNRCVYFKNKYSQEGETDGTT